MPEPMSVKIPVFSGKLRPGETEREETGTKVDIFFDALDNYFSHKGIADNATKLWILFNHISKKNGDAIDMMVFYMYMCNNKEDENYDDIKRAFLTWYGN